MAPSRSPAGPVIRSRRHPTIRALRDLAGDGAAREREGAFVADGVRLLEEALRRRVPIPLAITSPRLARSERGRRLAAGLAAAADRVLSARDDALEAVIGAPRHQGAVVRLLRQEAEIGEVIGERPVLVAVGIQDPGNLGGLVRVAAAAGAGGLLALPGCADPWGPKAVRGSAGAIFHLPVRRATAPEAATALAAAGFTRLAAVPRGGRPYHRLDWDRPVALYLGAEGAGLEEGLLAEMDGRVHIPMERGMESLNVLSAATLLLYEAARGRRRGNTGG